MANVKLVTEMRKEDLCGSSACASPQLLRSGQVHDWELRPPDQAAEIWPPISASCPESAGTQVPQARVRSITALAKGPRYPESQDRGRHQPVNTPGGVIGETSPSGDADHGSPAVVCREKRQADASDDGQQAFRAILGAAIRYRQGRRPNFEKYQVDCMLETGWGWQFPACLTYEPDNDHSITLAIRLAKHFQFEARDASRLLLRAKGCCRLTRVVANDEGDLFVQAIALGTPDRNRLPLIVRRLFAETLTLLMHDPLRAALGKGHAELCGQPMRECRD